jgi:hypothetical protein
MIGHVPKGSTEFEIRFASAVLQVIAQVGEHVPERRHGAMELDHLPGQLVRPLRGMGFGGEHLDLDLVEVDLELL